MDFDNKIEIFCRYIKRNGKVIYPKNGTLVHFFVDADKAVEKTDSAAVAKEQKN